MPRPPRSLASLLAAALAVLPVPLLRAEAPKTTAASALSFIRTQSPPDGINSLQTLSAEYRPASGVGPSIWLIGVAHLGTPEYYGGLQKRLDAQTRVLFEGVGADKLSEGAKLDNSDGLQAKLAQSLGLVFQLDAIDYHRKHFINSDLTADALNEAIERRSIEPAAPESTPPLESTPGKSSDEKTAKTKPALPGKVNQETFSQLMDALHGKGEMAESLNGMVTLLGSTPEMRETTKVMFIEALGQAGELIDLAKAASPEMKNLFEVLITERNAQVIHQLDQQLHQLKTGQTVAVFYGAAHMDELARRVTAELKYLPANQSWDTAFTADTHKSIMPPAQIKMIMQMMRAQLANPDAAAASGDQQPAFPLFNLLPSNPPAPTPEGAKPAKKP